MSRPRKQNQLCFARRHMPPAVFAFYNYALNVSRESGVFWRSDRRDALEFGETGVGKNTVTRWVKYLEQHGWMIPARESRKQRRAGSCKFESTPYVVLDHDAWAAGNRNRCRYQAGNPVPVLGTGNEKPVPVLYQNQSPLCSETSPHFGDVDSTQTDIKTEQVQVEDGKRNAGSQEDRDYSNTGGIGNLKKASLLPAGSFPESSKRQARIEQREHTPETIDLAPPDLPLPGTFQLDDDFIYFE